MQVLFENNIDEIPQVVQLCKKNKNSISFEFKNTKKLQIDLYNGKLCNSQMSTNACVHMRLISKEGYIIEGSSNRLYLSDVMSRLYQSLENLLKTNKGHKIQSKIPTQNITTYLDQKANEKNLDNLNYFDISHLKTLLTELFRYIPDSLKNDIHLKLSITGIFEQNLKGTSMGEKFNHDEVSINLLGEVYSTSNIIGKKFIKKVLLKDLKSKEIYISKLGNEIIKYAQEINN